MESPVSAQLVTGLSALLYGFGCALAGRGISRLFRKGRTAVRILWVLLCTAGYFALSLLRTPSGLSLSYLLVCLGGMAAAQLCRGRKPLAGERGGRVKKR